MRFIQKYWLDLVGGISTVALLAWAWYAYGWKYFIIWGLSGVLGYIAIFYFGELMPIVGYFIRKWDREKHEHNKPGRGTDKGNS